MYSDAYIFQCEILIYQEYLFVQQCDNATYNKTMKVWYVPQKQMTSPC